MVSAHDPQLATAPEGADPVISHFIPSVELTGSREEKLRKLDTLIVYLHQLRERLAGDHPTIRPATKSLASRPWPWFTAGFVIGAVCVLLLLTVRRWGL